MKVKVLICEDERACIVHNEACIRTLNEKFKIEAEIFIASGSEVKETSYDIAFLDIDLGMENGIDVAKRIQRKNKAAVIIFVTSHAEYALDACKMQCFGYLLKPLDVLKLEQLYAKAVIQVKGIQSRSIEACINICVDRKQLAVNQRDIIYIERIERKVKIVTLTNMYMINESIQAIIQKLTDYFIQVNQSTILNAREVQSLESNIFYMKTGHQFKIGRAYKDAKNIYYNLAKIR